MTTSHAASFGHGPVTLRLGDLEVVRLGYGAMRLPGPEVWGEPDDPDRARAVLRRAVELGMNLINARRRAPAHHGQVFAGAFRRDARRDLSGGGAALG